ncbi:DUF5677 domain-containing protein [Haloplanus aerogenes]|uniref:Uncharacterized protein n=1 Tax=Haloplanus aerogenes TaxID=660522 RepID=A0A3M0EBV0_9EURY|nr:DUF5677 domain-containing protein [Haloplanus aerogenes]AZH25661.1 hypothetical protein DU502_09845 [Haloplanus aerogenes]RMB25390.1 hypothetical protein ATH50_0479 [Haloplanus aerogenes]
MVHPDWFAEAVEKALDSDPDIPKDVTGVEWLVREYTDRLLTEYAEKYPAVINEEAETRGGFEERLHKRWGDAFNLFEYLIILNHQSGVALKQQLIENEVPEDDPLFSALMRLHARACQVAREVLSLMRTGYADGAFARWRALYEIAVSSRFIEKYGEDIARRFLEHKIVDDYREIELYRDHREELGFAPVPEEEWAALKERFESKVEEYGGVFKTSYGWAAPELDKNPSRRTIAEDVDLDRYEPFFAFASNTVHGGSKGTLFRMGLTEETQSEVMLSGPSNTGFTDPAQFSALALVEVTDALLSAEDELEWKLVSTSLSKLIHEVVAAFDDVRKDLEAEVSQAEGKGYTIGGR